MTVRQRMTRLLAERAQTPPQIKHCVAKVAPKLGDDTSRAFAICVAQMQKSGQVKSGSLELTTKGKKAAKEKSAQPTHSDKVSDYETLLKKNRKS